MTYQSFDDKPGSSKSDAKLQAIRLPDRLEGKRVLDVGCNEGFFSFEAKRRGAAQVIGLDANPAAIDRARRRGTEVAFLLQSWDTLPAGRFDIILFLSALHYESRPRELLQRLCAHLTEDGFLILECGVAMRPDTSLQWTQRHDVVQHPTWNMLIDHYLEPFAVRLIGPSVNQAGDPMGRYVFHCYRRKPIVVLIRGHTGSGKTIFARELANQRSVQISVDHLLTSMKRMKHANTPLLKEVSACIHDGITSLDQIVRRLETRNLTNQLAEAILAQIPLDERLIVIEGHALTNQVVARITESFDGKALVWVAQRSRTEEEFGELETTTRVNLERARADIQRLRTELQRLRLRESSNRKELALLKEELSLSENRLHKARSVED